MIWAWVLLFDDFKNACKDNEYEKPEFWDFLEKQLVSAGFGSTVYAMVYIHETNCS
jgi:hypothetical protein